MQTKHHDKPQLANETNLRNISGNLNQLCRASAGAQRYTEYQGNRSVISLSMRAAF